MAGTTRGHLHSSPSLAEGHTATDESTFASSLTLADIRRLSLASVSKRKKAIGVVGLLRGNVSALHCRSTHRVNSAQTVGPWGGIVETKAGIFN